MLPADCRLRNKAGPPSKGADTVSAEWRANPNPDWSDKT